MGEQSKRRELREFADRPTFLKLCIAAFRFGFLGAVFTAMSAFIIALVFNDAPIRPIVAAVAVGTMPAWVFYGVSLALLPAEGRIRQMLVVAIILITSLWVSYIWQHGSILIWYTERRGGYPEPLNLFSRVTVVATMSIAVGSLILSKLTRNFKI